MNLQEIIGNQQINLVMMSEQIKQMADSNKKLTDEVKKLQDLTAAQNVDLEKITERNKELEVLLQRKVNQLESFRCESESDA